MILRCNSCEKKFVVPDVAITATGRIVQCGSCGNKWKQFPSGNQVSKTISKDKIIAKKITSLPKPTKQKRKRIKKTREINLYSPEYLEKKHGIIINDINSNSKNRPAEKVTFGFYNSIILFIVLFIALSKSLHFFQYYIIQKLPFTEFYINYFFENIKNIFEICKNLIF
jgi:predicted Zn finger-like uncharacterized protein